MRAVLSYTVLIGKCLIPRIGELGRGKIRVKSVQSAKEGVVVGTKLGVYRDGSEHSFVPEYN
jgi:hypothetical protein